MKCSTGETLAREQAEAADKEHVIEALAQASASMRERLGESLGRVVGEDRAYAQRVTTSSLEALQAFHLGDEEWITTGNASRSVPHYERAVQLDPDFAIAWLLLGSRYLNMGDRERALECTQRAMDLANKVSDRERLFIEERYYGVRGDYARQLPLQETLVRQFPRDAYFHLNLASSYMRRGEWEKALVHSDAGLRAGPRVLQAYNSKINALTGLNRMEESKAVIRSAFKAGFDTAGMRGSLLYLAYASDDAATRDEQLRWFDANPGERTRALREQANAAAAFGRYGEARTLYARGEQDGRQPSSPVPSQRFTTQLAESSALLGDCRAARRVPDSYVVTTLCGTMAEKIAAADKTDETSGPEGAARAVALLATNRTAAAHSLFMAMVAKKATNWGAEYPAAFVGKARAEVALGDIPAAKKTYEEFFAFWKDADQDVPLLVAARKEYGSLK